MHLIITDAWLAKSRPIHLTGSRLVLSGLALALALMVVVAGLYHWVFLEGARQGWPVVGSLVRLVTKDDLDQQDRFLRENIDAMARRVGEMQARMTQLESLGERVSGLAGVNPGDLRTPPGQGGVLIPGPALSLVDLNATLSAMEDVGNQRSDFLTVIESRLAGRKTRRHR